MYQQEEDLERLCSDFSERAERKITRRDLLKGNDKKTGTNALAILLGRHDFSSRIQCARFKGTERVNFLDKKEFEGPLCEQIDGAFSFVLEHINIGLEIEGIVHKEKYELPPAAIRELIINAAVHRNYQQHSSIQVAVYDDRVEISSPGGLYGALTLEDALQGRSSLRNQTLARTLEKIGVIEGWGSGFKRIFDLCDEQGIKRPELLEIGDMLRVNFYRPSYESTGYKSALSDKMSDKMSDKEKSRLKTIIDYLAGNSSITSSKAAEILDVENKTANRLLVKAVELGILSPDGENKNRTYSMKKQN